MKITASDGGRPREIVLGLAYLPYDDAEPPPPEELEKLVMGCRAQGTHLITPPGEVQTSTTEVSPCLITLWLMDWT